MEELRQQDRMVRQPRDYSSSGRIVPVMVGLWELWGQGYSRGDWVLLVGARAMKEIQPLPGTLPEVEVEGAISWLLLSSYLPVLHQCFPWTESREKPVDPGALEIMSVFINSPELKGSHRRDLWE